ISHKMQQQILLLILSASALPQYAPLIDDAIAYAKTKK
ncbi:hypothetical protein AAUPMC_16945, partial [Pasteurella multocida subsp. multocida str. Anand1_cattle]